MVVRLSGDKKAATEFTLTSTLSRGKRAVIFTCASTRGVRKLSAWLPVMSYWVTLLFLAKPMGVTLKPVRLSLELGSWGEISGL